MPSDLIYYTTKVIVMQVWMRIKEKVGERVRVRVTE